ncbi:exosortase/archaeosortase family protein [Methanoplanus limicola]|uniref:Exosortase EpsH-related protein n=1 Tax=Methanoplanus limicola DSM 2279 TaxID=937775 RepID=H1YZS4_9EURY|nr:exosortase/archaeosortase family protein [Methanoplanus limicola]EHQ34336.1 Exosortase EpsH-related protein [Methanoplanus limicola DSM 2279]
MPQTTRGVNSPAVIALIWIILIIILLSVYFITTPSSYSKMDALLIWILSCISLLYLSTKDQICFNKKDKIFAILAGTGVCIFSFLNIPLGLGNPPYSIGEFSILLSGAGIILFGIAGYKKLILPVLFPLIAVLGFEGYEIFLRNQDWLIGPLIPPTVMLSSGIMNIAGLNPTVSGNTISYLSVSGETINLAIVYDCTGIWSLGTFTVASLIVLSTFPESINLRSVCFVSIGYIGTYAANIGRIFLISLSGYIYGPVGVIEQVHVHIGWVLFTIWMIIFWYIYFKHFIDLKFLNKISIE